MTKKIRLACGLLAVCALLATGETTRAQSLLGASKRSSQKARPAAPKGKTTARRRPAAPAKPRESSKAAAERAAGPTTARPNALLIGLLENVSLQAALDDAGFSPGIIDGVPGRKTEAAIRAFQTSRGLPATGKMDEPTRVALSLPSREALRPYIITEGDAALIAPPPKTWMEKSRVSLLGYASMASLVAERGHCTTALLGRLNPGVRLDALAVGQTVSIPNVESLRPSSVARAGAIEVDLTARTIRVIDEAGKVTGLYHCSIAEDRRKRPSETCTVQNIVENPKYTFDPLNWPEVKDVKQKLLIPAGPRNPVGICWIGLSKQGYGIHGTPEPENIGKTGSHGCFRLTNWDALRLSRQVKIGAEVRFTESAAELAGHVDRAGER